MTQIPFNSSAQSIDSSILIIDPSTTTFKTDFLAEAQPYLDKITAAELVFLSSTFTLTFLLSILILHYFSICRDPTQPLLKLSSFKKSNVFSPTVIWLCLSSIIHMFLELHFVFFRTSSSIHHSMNLYAAADLRYTSPIIEIGTAAMETITSLIVGPLCLLLAHAIITNQPYRHPLQLIVSTCQMYGLSWFILHGVFSDEPIASSDPFLFWVIFVGLNMPWGM